MGSHGRTGSGGEQEDSGVPGNHTKDALPAQSPHSSLPGTEPPPPRQIISIAARPQPLSVLFFSLLFPPAEHRPAFPGVADKQFRREPALPQLQAGFQ